MAVVLGSAMMFMALVFTLIGVPFFFADWLRARRRAVIARQIALTEAFDARLGVLVAPTVRKPLFGPWEIAVSVPLPLPSPALPAKMLAVTDAMFGGDGTASRNYRMVLAARPRSLRTVPDRSTSHWARTPFAAV